MHRTFQPKILSFGIGDELGRSFRAEDPEQPPAEPPPGIAGRCSIRR